MTKEATQNSKESTKDQSWTTDGTSEDLLAMHDLGNIFSGEAFTLLDNFNLENELHPDTEKVIARKIEDFVKTIFESKLGTHVTQSLSFEATPFHISIRTKKLEGLHTIYQPVRSWNSGYLFMLSQSLVFSYITTELNLHNPTNYKLIPINKGK